ncbi:Venom carboxylesterase-6 [Gryllus bimaculatus]|nr:Venom carboxylesterase-6 [Gryllus bimaculatus]
MGRSQRSAAATATSWTFALWALWALAVPARALIDSPRLIGARAYDAPLTSTAPSPYTNGAADADLEDPVVTISKGTLRGSLLQSRLGRLIYAFRGIRYVQAPVGPLRFQPPQPYPAWEGVFNATEDGPACPQENGYSFPTNEDCLFLNVYTTQLPTARTNPKRPVFLYIHMGGWYGNNARSDNHGPQYLADQDLVIVTFNYRLGALGFISTGDDVLTGNYAMKDQVAAMRWVQENIEAFGGDPNRVTLAGYSAGAAAVWFHLASPMSRGLFQQAMALSASINAQYDLTEDVRNPLELARRQAQVAGCTEVGTSQQIKDCLMELPAQQISGVLAAGELFDWGIDPVLIWYPVVEKDTPGEEHFLTQNVQDIFLSGNFTQVPWITGRTRDEFDWRASTVFNDDSLRTDMNEHWDAVAPKAFMYVTHENSDYISDQLREFYIHNGDVTAENVDPLGKLYSDSIIGFGEDRAVKTVASLSKAPVWYYNFEYQGRYSYQYRGNTSIPYGVMHQDDVMYFFYLAAVFPYFDSSAPENWAIDRLTKLWGNFVIHGHPTPEADPLLDNVIWEPFTVENLNYLNFANSTLDLRQGLFQDRMDTWSRLFPEGAPPSA